METKTYHHGGVDAELVEIGGVLISYSIPDVATQDVHRVKHPVHLVHQDPLS